ncbi:MAG: hypothetical protein ACOZAO_02355 [Patescibacteria group bacterium]
MGTFHTRQEPNGSQAKVVVVGRKPESLKFGEKVRILVEGVEAKGVVDVIVAAFWGGPKAALEHWNKYKTPHPRAKLKIVWEYAPGEWDESRDFYSCSPENFEAWIKAFKGNKPPTPMP